MGECSSWLAALVFTDVITVEQADWIWVQLGGQPVPHMPSQIILQVGPLIERAREMFPFG